VIKKLRMNTGTGTAMQDPVVLKCMQEVIIQNLLIEVHRVINSLHRSSYQHVSKFFASNKADASKDFQNNSETQKYKTKMYFNMLVKKSATKFKALAVNKMTRYSNIRYKVGTNFI
jgi:hypothetical protein